MRSNAKIFSILLLIGALLPFFIFAQDKNNFLRPPLKEANNFVQRITTSTKPFLGIFKNFCYKKIVPFFLNLGKTIEMWWYQKGKITFLNLWNQIILFLNKEIVIR
jgi:hypothetical protein